MKFFQLIPFVKHWTEIYLPIADNAKPREKSFHCIESIANLANLSMRLPDLPSPFVAMETNIGGDITDKFLMPQYNIYFFVKATQKAGVDTDLDDAATKDEAMTHAVEFLNYLRSEKEKHSNDRQFPLMGIDTDNVHFETFGPIHNRWFAEGLSLVDLGKYSRCVDRSLYRD